MIRPDRYLLRRAPTLERAIFARSIGHPVGTLNAANDDLTALSHCITCGEMPHGGWVSGPCGWSGCELRPSAGTVHSTGDTHV